MQSSFQRLEWMQKNQPLQQQQYTSSGLFWTLLMKLAKQATDASAARTSDSSLPPPTWTPQLLLQVLLEYKIRRPPSPERSIAHHNAQLAKSVAHIKATSRGVGIGSSGPGDMVRMGSDGMYETHLIVSASRPVDKNTSSPTDEDALEEQQRRRNSVLALATGSSSLSRALTATTTHSKASNLILDATKGVLVLSSTIILLPFRLMSLALGLWAASHAHRKEKGYDQAHRQHLLQLQSRLTKDVLWLSDSPVADLSSCLLLLFTNNERASQNHPFRDQLAQLKDNRWGGENDYYLTATQGTGLPDLPDSLLVNSNNENHGDLETFNASLVDLDDESSPFAVSTTPVTRRRKELGESTALTINFEALFESFGRTTHNEVGALLLYTMLQGSQAFADSIAVRSDLDTLVMPLLRTLYFASASSRYMADFTGGGESIASSPKKMPRRPSNGSVSSSSAQAETTGAISPAWSIRSCPFRSQSQIYVIVILLLLFSQDSSFGSDAFRRAIITGVPWYKERHIKEISLGSILLLCLLRSLVFNLNRFHDSFLLSNCCAILMNLSPSIVDLHEYAAMRLVAVALSTMKRYATLRQQEMKMNPSANHHDEDDDQNENELSTPLDMHREVAQTLLRLLKQCLSAKNIERNLHLVYALVYHQTDFKKIVSAKGMVDGARVKAIVSDSGSLTIFWLSLFL